MLYNAATGKRVATLSDENVISLSAAGGPFLNIEAEVNKPGVESVVFMIDGVCLDINGRCLENTPPYTMAGDIDGRHYDNWDWSSMVGRTYTFEIVPYARDFAEGERLPSVMMTLTVNR